MKEKIRKIVNNEIFENIMPILTLAIFVAFFGIVTGGKFVKPTNLKLIMNQATVIALISTGAVFIYSSGNMNVAMGCTTCIIVMIAVQIYLHTGSFPLMILGAIICSMIIMAFIVLLGRLLKISMQALTMLMMTFFSSLQTAILAKSGWQVPVSEILPLREANVPIIMLIIYLLLAIFVFDFTSLGRNLKYIGENSVCAHLTGIKDGKKVAIGYIFCSIGIGLGACAYIIRNSNINISSGSGLNMDVILAMVLAGSPLKGGSKSKAFAGVIGAFLSIGLGNGLLMLGVGSYYIQIIKGVIFIIILCTTSKRPENLPVKQML